MTKNKRKEKTIFDMDQRGHKNRQWKWMHSDCAHAHTDCNWSHYFNRQLIRTLTLIIGWEQSVEMASSLTCFMIILLHDCLVQIF